MAIVLKWLRNHYQRVAGSIALLPALIALFFLILALGMVWFDFSAWGKNIKSNLHWLSLKDASTARSIISAIVTSIISLSVFSFSMVMIILNQTASNMSNRILDKLIGNRFQQVVLGCYVGSIVYALFLLSTIRDINEGVYVPALSTYLLIAFTILDIFLFIYFLHYVTQSVKYETIIRRIARHTRNALEKTCTVPAEEVPIPLEPGIQLGVPETGVLQKVHTGELVSFCRKHRICMAVLHPPGSFLLQGTPYVQVSGTGAASLPQDATRSVHAFFDIQQGHTLEANYHYGFRQLMEVAVKALSPGINDPGTALESLQAIIALLQYRKQHHPQCNFYDEDGMLRLVLKEQSFDQLFNDTLGPVWHYGHKDPLIQQGLYQLLQQLDNNDSEALSNLLLRIKQEQVQSNDALPV